jgi:hypothetical protein
VVKGLLLTTSQRTSNWQLSVLVRLVREMSKFPPLLYICGPPAEMKHVGGNLHTQSERKALSVGYPGSPRWCCMIVWVRGRAGPQRTRRQSAKFWERGTWELWGRGFSLKIPHAIDVA